MDTSTPPPNSTTNTPQSSVGAVAGSRRGSDKLSLVAPVGSSPQSFGVPRRPQSLPPKPHTDSVHDVRTTIGTRFDSTSAADKSDSQLLFRTDSTGSGHPTTSSTSPSAKPKTTSALSSPSANATGLKTDAVGTHPSTTTTATNLYTSISQVLQAKTLDFRKSTAPESYPADILKEDSAGIFMGQLPSSYSEEDIECLLRALGRMHGKLVHVRDVKSHLRDRTCAFVMVNVSSVAPIIDFSKRVLCDMNNVWVVAAAQASALLVYINNIPRQQLRGVPKLPLVLERLTHGGRSRRGSASQTVSRESARATDPAAHGAQQQMRMDMPLGVPTAAPSFAQMVSLAGGSRRGSADSTGSLQSFTGASALQTFSMVAPGQLYQPGAMPMYSVAGVPQAGQFQTLVPTAIEASPAQSQRASLNSHLMPYAEVQQRPSFASQSHLNAEFVEAGGGGAGFNLATPIATFTDRKASGGTGEMGEMWSVSTQSHGISAPYMSSQLGDTSLSSNAESLRRATATSSIPVTSIPTVLSGITCSCSQFLRLSVMPISARCAQCTTVLDPGMVAYWCPSGHLCVCTNCGVRFAMSSPFAVPHVEPTRPS